MAVASASTPFRLFKYSVLLISFFTFLAWLLLLGGISALEDVYSNSRSILGLPWFILWFQLLIIVPAILSEFFDQGGAWRTTINLLLAINTTLAIQQCQNFFVLRDQTGSNSRINATIAGFILTSIFNLLLIILSGSRTAVNARYAEDRDVGVATYPPKSQTPAAGPAAPQVTVPPAQSGYAASGTSNVPAAV